MMSLRFSPTSIAPISHGGRLTLPLLHPPSTSLRPSPAIQFPRKSSITATNFDKGGDLGGGAADFDWGDSYSDDDDGVVEVEVEDEESPWQGAVVYKRSSTVSHIEHCTTLERLGLGKISSELSRSTAAAMGLRLTKAVKEFRDGTPVLVSIDVTRKRRDLIRLDGILRTVISLRCNRCAEPAAESVFSNFTLLLTDEQVEPPEVINLGVIYGQDKRNPSAAINVDDSDEASIDLDDRLYFPPEDKEIDISKQIRDLVHIEITINAVCDPNCKGLCLKCGVNLNTDRCNCDKQEFKDAVSRPLGNLRKQMQQN